MNKRHARLISALVLIIIIIFSSAGCVRNDSEKTASNNQKQDVNQLLRTDKNIIDSNITRKNDVVSMKITFTKDISKDEALNLASVYIELAKEQYKGNYLNVQILQNDDVIGGASIGK